MTMYKVYIRVTEKDEVLPIGFQCIYKGENRTTAFSTYNKFAHAVAKSCTEVKECFTNVTEGVRGVLKASGVRTDNGRKLEVFLGTAEDYKGMIL